MKITTALWTFTVLVTLVAGAAGATGASRPVHLLGLSLSSPMQAPPQAAQAKPQWSGTEEYQAWQAVMAEKTPSKLISLADAFLQKYPNSPGKVQVLTALMGAYFQSNDAAKAVETGQKLLVADPDNLDALTLLSYVFPFTFNLKPDDPEFNTKLSRADSDAHHGLEVLQKLQKPADVSEEKFKQYVQPKRSIFNNCIGFVALQRKDYAASITALKAGSVDNPSDVYTFYREGLAYLYSTPPDTDHALWYIARAVALAQASKPPNPAGDEINKFLRRAYVNYHGNDQGLQDVITQAAATVDPPAGFKVAPMEIPKQTGNSNIDAFNTMTFPLKLGGEKAQKQWDMLKGQPLELGGFVDSVEKGTDPGVYMVRIDILEESKAQAGVYDIELKDASQPNVKNLSPGDVVRFKGTIVSYTATPSLVLSIEGTLNPEDVPDQPKGKPKPVRPPGQTKKTTKKTTNN